MEESMKFGLKKWAVMTALLASAGLVHAQDFPSRALRIIVPYAAGGQPDTLARALSPSLIQQFNQPVIIDNIPGSGAVAAMTAVQQAVADGHTLFTADAGHWAISPALRRRQNDFLRDFIPVRQTHVTALVLVAHSSVGAATWQELFAVMKAAPGKFSYGSSGIGSVHHLAFEMVKSTWGVDALHVPFKSTSQAFPAVLAGQVSMTLTALGAVKGFMNDPRVKVIGVTSKKRTRLAPNLPSVSELGHPEFDYGSGGAMMVKVGTPRPLVERLNAALNRAFNSPELVQRLNAIEIEFIAQGTPEEALEMIKADIPRYVNAVKVANPPSPE
jgi:tripartite-type tricarboxylate transporter receptor subunit TctC